MVFDKVWSFLERPLTQMGAGMVLAILGTMLPSKIAMFVAGTVFLVAAYREGWFKNDKWWIVLFRVVAASTVIAFSARIYMGDSLEISGTTSRFKWHYSKATTAIY